MRLFKSGQNSELVLRVAVMASMLVFAAAANADSRLALDGDHTLTETTININDLLAVEMMRGDATAETLYMEFLPASHVGETYSLNDAVAVNPIVFLSQGPGLYEIQFAEGSPTGLVFSVTLCGLAIDDVYVHLLDDGGGIIDTTTVHIIPEPTTLVLVALGLPIISRLRRRI